MFPRVEVSIVQETGERDKVLDEEYVAVVTKVFGEGPAYVNFLGTWASINIHGKMREANIDPKTGLKWALPKEINGWRCDWNRKTVKISAGNVATRIDLDTIERLAEAARKLKEQADGK